MLEVRNAQDMATGLRVMITHTITLMTRYMTTNMDTVTPMITAIRVTYTTIPTMKNMIIITEMEKN